ncbi:hypothetical protein [uncultured Roseobacter sp.]|uniref:hypothetical protein n=1 Tax=uncultured Roseobacter sp. TaxID=114847 RepID=UPI00261B48F4|nr:hypothetical protein [uncultured Roseobacter sp.]
MERKRRAMIFVKEILSTGGWPVDINLLRPNDINTLTRITMPPSGQKGAKPAPLL